MNRRQFASTLGAAVAGIVAGRTLLADDKPAKDTSKDHVCAGKNACKGQGGCHTKDNSCAGQNACKGKGGCASASMQHECAGKNACKGQGGCKTAKNRCAGRTPARLKAAARSPPRRRLPGGHRRRPARLPLMGDRFGLPDLGVGVGLRTVHFGHVLSKEPDVDLFEIDHARTSCDTGGRPLHVLDRVAERYPVVLHGVSMSIGGTDPLDLGYLAEAQGARATRTRAPWVSDHLCWTGVVGPEHARPPAAAVHRGDAAPRRRARPKRCTDVLERPLVLENASSYLEFAARTMTECRVPRARSAEKPTAACSST